MTIAGEQNDLDLISIVGEINRVFAESLSFVYIPGDVAEGPILGMIANYPPPMSRLGAIPLRVAASLLYIDRCDNWLGNWLRTSLRSWAFADAVTRMRDRASARDDLHSRLKPSMFEQQLHSAKYCSALPWDHQCLRWKLDQKR